MHKETCKNIQRKMLITPKSLKQPKCHYLKNGHVGMINTEVKVVVTSKAQGRICDGGGNTGGFVLFVMHFLN